MQIWLLKEKLESKKIIALIVLGIILFGAGYITGTIITIKAVVEIGSHFIDIDYDAVNAAIFMYKNRINGCYPQNITN